MTWWMRLLGSLPDWCWGQRAGRHWGQWGMTDWQMLRGLTYTTQNRLGGMCGIVGDAHRQSEAWLAQRPCSFDNTRFIGL